MKIVNTNEPTIYTAPWKDVPLGKYELTEPGLGAGAIDVREVTIERNQLGELYVRYANGRGVHPRMPHKIEGLHSRAVLKPKPKPEPKKGGCILA